MMTDRARLPLSTICACLTEKRIWIYSDTLNALFSRSIDDAELTYVTYLEESRLPHRSLFTGVVCYQDKLVFIPCYADHVAVYEIGSGAVRHINFPLNCTRVTPYHGMHHGHHLLLFPAVYRRSAWHFDMENEELRRITLDFGEYDDWLSQRINQLLFVVSCMDDEELIFSVYDTNILGYLSWRSGRMRFADSSVPSPIMSTLLMGNKRDRLYLDINGQSVFFYRDGRQIRHEKLPVRYMFDVSSTGHKRAYSQIVTYASNDAVMMPTFGNDVLIWHDGEWSNISVPWQDFLCLGSAVEPFSVHLETKDMVMFLPYQTDKMLCIWPVERRVDCQDFYVPMQLVKEVLERQEKGGARDSLPLFHEGEMTLRDLSNWSYAPFPKHTGIGKYIYENII